MYKCRQTDGFDKQDPSFEKLTKTVELWGNCSITITYNNYTKAVRVMNQEKKCAEQNMCFIFSETFVLNIFVAPRLKKE